MADEKLLALVEKAIHGDKEAFEEICALKGKSIIYIALRMVGNMQEAEDAAQEVMVYMYSYITRLEHPKAFNAWLYQIVRGVCCNRIRKEKFTMSMLEEGEDRMMEERKDFLPYEFYEDNAKREKLLEIVDKLPERQRMCVLLFYYENLSYLEIGNALSLTKKEVEYALTKSRKVIRKTLEKDKAAKKLLSAIPAAVPVPVLAQIFMEDADKFVSEDVLCRVSDGWKAVVAGTSMLTFSEKSVSGSGKAAVGGMAAKTIIGIAVATGITAGVIHYTQNEETGQNEDNYPIAEQREEGENQVDEEIRTLADMIGEEPAVVLSGYILDETLPKDTVEAFIEEHGLEARESMWMEVTMTEDTLYTLEKQNKLLILITRYNKKQNNYGMAYKFTEVTEELPRDVEINISYDSWK